MPSWSAAWRRLRDACTAPGAAGAGGCLVDDRGQPQVGFMVRQLPTAATLALEVLLLNRIWPNNPVNRRYRGLRLDYGARIPVEQPAGAFLMLRREVWEELGGFDESFWPLWFEDVDFCRRAADRGYRFYFEPRAVAKHTGGHSVAGLTVEKRRVYWYGSLLSYSAKHFSPTTFRLVCLAVVTGSLLRSLGESVRYRSLRSLAAYGKVVRYASRCFFLGWGGRSGFVRPHSIPGRSMHNKSNVQVFAHVAKRLCIRYDRHLQQRPLHQALPGIGAGAEVPAQGSHRRGQRFHRRHHRHPGTVRRPLPAFTTTRKTSVSPRRRTRPSSSPMAIGF